MSEFESVERYLPESVKEIVDLIGLPATEKLIKAFGGFSFQFSKGKVYFEKLKEVLGEEEAEKLYACRCGCRCTSCSASGIGLCRIGKTACFTRCGS